MLQLLSQRLSTTSFWLGLVAAVFLVLHQSLGITIAAGTQSAVVTLVTAIVLGSHGLAAAHALAPKGPVLPPATGQEALRRQNAGA